MCNVCMFVCNEETKIERDESGKKKIANGMIHTYFIYLLRKALKMMKEKVAKKIIAFKHTHTHSRSHTEREKNDDIY